MDEDINRGSINLNAKETNKILKTLKYSDQVLCTAKGDIYRIATIVDPRFSDKVAINPSEHWEQEMEARQDELNMGLFCVESRTEFSTV